MKRAGGLKGAAILAVAAGIVGAIGCAQQRYLLVADGSKRVRSAAHRLRCIRCIVWFGGKA